MAILGHITKSHPTHLAAAEPLTPIGSPSKVAAQSIASGKGIVPSASKRPNVAPIPLYARSSLAAVMNRVMELSGTHQAEVARRMNVRPQSLNQYVKNKRSKPSLEWLIHFLQVNGAFLAIVFPQDGQYRNIQLAAAELFETPRSWEFEDLNQSALPLEDPQSKRDSNIDTRLDTGGEGALDE